MSEQKRYTAHEMREAANTLEVNARDIIADCNLQGGSTNRTLYKEYAEDDIKFAAMLRHAAEMLENEEVATNLIKELGDYISEFGDTPGHTIDKMMDFYDSKLRGDAKKEEK